jgi:hypothetical protein
MTLEPICRLPTTAQAYRKLEVSAVVVPEMLEDDEDEDYEPENKDVEVVLTGELGNALPAGR